MLRLTGWRRRGVGRNDSVGRAKGFEDLLDIVENDIEV